jgi:hypothetical protein
METKCLLFYIVRKFWYSEKFRIQLKNLAEYILNNNQFGKLKQTDLIEKLDLLINLSYQ